MSDRVDNPDFAIRKADDLALHSDLSKLDAFLNVSASPGPAQDTAVRSPVSPGSRRESAPTAPRPAWRHTQGLRDQYIPRTLCPAREYLTTAGILSHYDAIVTYDGVLLSDLYYASYMYEETYVELGFTMTPGSPGRTVNPRGGIFNPIAKAEMCVWFDGRDSATPDWVEVHILPGSPSQTGVRFILGAPDIKRLFGQDWTPQRHLERMSKTQGASLTFGH